MPAAACRGCRSSNRSASRRRRSRSRCRTSIAIGWRDARPSAAASLRRRLRAARVRRVALQGARLDRRADVRHRPRRRRRRPGLKGPITASEQTDEFEPRRRGPLAAGAVRHPPDLRRRERPHADSSAAGPRSPRHQCRRTSPRSAPPR